MYLLRQVPSNLILYCRSVLPCTRPPAGIYPEGQSVRWAPGGRRLSSGQEGELTCGNASFFLFQDQLSTLNKWTHTVTSFHVSQSFLKITLFICLWLCWVLAVAPAFLELGRAGLLSRCGARPSRRGGFSCCGTRALGRAGFGSCAPASGAQVRACGAWASLL